MTEPAEVEGRLHPLAVLVIARRFVGASLLPVAALLLSLGTRILVPLVLAALFVGVPLAVLSWSRFRYRVAGGRLELHSGVLSRSVRIVPLDRVRGVDVTAPFLHRLLGLARVEVEAAAGGGKKAELSLSAVSFAEAKLLRETLLGASGPRAADADDAVPLYRATPRLLVLGGITSMRYLLAPAAVVGIVFNLADDLPGGLAERAGEAAADRVPTDALGIALLVVVGIALVVLAAAAGSLLVDWDFTLDDEGERLRARRGLLTRRVVFLDKDRIRGADIHDTPLRRALRLVSVGAIASGLQARTGKTTLAPVASALEAASLLRMVDPLAPAPTDPLTPHPAASLRRRLVRALPVPLALLVLGLALTTWWLVAVAGVLTALAVVVAVDRHRQLGHALAGRRLVLRGGSLQRRWSELDPGAAVSFELRSSPGQRRAGLCTLRVHLGQGAGSRRALDIGTEQAAALLPRLHPRLLEPLLARSPRED